VNFELQAKPAAKTIAATVELSRAGSPRELHVKLRLPLEQKLQSTTVNGQPASLGGPHFDTVIIQTRGRSRFEVTGQLV
jgi:hypothetical protein